MAERVIGIDVSLWNDNNSTAQGVNFYKAYTSGARFVFVKSSQANFEDPDFQTNWRNSKAAGLLRGAYHFMTYDTDPVDQARLMWFLLYKDPGELRPVIDFEWYRQTPSNAITFLRQFVDELMKFTRERPIIYTSPGFWREFGNSDPYWRDFPLWIAHYGVSQPTVPYPWANWTFWQFSSHGDGPLYGTESLNVDLNWYNGSLTQLYQSNGLTPPQETHRVYIPLIRR